MVAADLKKETFSLMDARTAMEAEMDAIIESLCRLDGPGLAGNLLDAEGFPRSDIDIPAIRSQRNRLAALHNDHKDITDKIEKNLQVLHSVRPKSSLSLPNSSGSSISSEENISSQGSSVKVDPIVRIPFAMVDEIAEDSPAAEDGLQLGDEIVKFGNVEIGGELQTRLVAEAQSNQGKPIPLIIIRQGSVVNLTVTPRPWTGRGMLGCHFQIL